MNQDDSYLSFNQAARLMGCSREWIKYLREREGAAMGEVMVAGAVKLHRDTFLAWMNEYNRTRKRVQKVKTSRD